MTSIVNFERDLYWTNNAARVASFDTAFQDVTLTVGNDGVVAQRENSVQSIAVTTVGSGTDMTAVGCMILPPPDGDAVPYRVKAAVSSPGQGIYGFGYRTTGNSVQRPRIIGAGPSLDELVLIYPLDSGDPNYGDPLIFFAGMRRTVAASAIVGVSVQRLISKPPQFATAVS